MTSPGGFEVGRVSIRVLPDMSKFRKELKRELEKIEKSLKVEIPVELNTKAARAQLKALDQAVDRLDGRTININTDIDKGLFKGGLGDAEKSLSKLGENLEKAGGGFGRMGHGAAIALAVLVLLAPLLGLIATLIAGLPSLLFVAGAGFAAIALGMEGIKDSAKVLGPQVESLKASLSETFRSGLTPVFEQLRGIFPVLEVGLNKVAQGLVNMVKPIADVILLPKNMERLTTILERVGVFFSELGPTIALFVDSLLMLGDVGSSIFEPLLNVLRDASQQFNDLVTEMIGSGDLSDALAGLATVFGSILNLFNRLFFIGVAVMDQMAQPMAFLFDSLGNILIAMMPTLVEISNLLFNVLGAALNALVPVFNVLNPVIAMLGKMLTDLLVGALVAVTPLLEALGLIINDVLVLALKAIEPLIPIVVDLLGKLANLLADILLQALEALRPLLERLVQFMLDLYVALEPLLPPLFELVEVLLKALLDVLIALIDPLLDASDVLLPALVKAVEALVPVLVDVIDILIEIIPYIADLIVWLVEKLVPAFEILVDIVNDAIPYIRDIIKNAFDFLKGLFDALAGALTGDWDRMWEGLKNAARAAWDFLANIFKGGIDIVLKIVLGLVSGIVSLFSDSGTKLYQSGKALIQGFINGINSLIQKAKNSIKSFVQSIRDYFPFSPAKVGPFSGKGYTTYSGRALMEDWAAGIASGEGAAVAAVQGVMDATQTSMDLNATAQADGFNGVSDQIATALSGWTVQMDANGLARLVRKANLRNERR